MKKILHGVYTRPGPKELVGETALLRANGVNGWLAQFDDLQKFSRNRYDWAIGWHRFSKDSFKLLEE